MEQIIETDETKTELTNESLLTEIGNTEIYKSAEVLDGIDEAEQAAAVAKEWEELNAEPIEIQRKLQNMKKLSTILGRTSRMSKEKTSKKVKFFSFGMDNDNSDDFNKVLIPGQDIILAQDNKAAFNIGDISEMGLILYRSSGKVSLKKNDIVFIETIHNGNSIDIFSFKVFDTVGNKSKLIVMK